MYLSFKTEASNVIACIKNGIPQDLAKDTKTTIGAPVKTPKRDSIIPRTDTGIIEGLFPIIFVKYVHDRYSKTQVKIIPPIKITFLFDIFWEKIVKAKAIITAIHIGSSNLTHIEVDVRIIP